MKRSRFSPFFILLLAVLSAFAGSGAYLEKEGVFSGLWSSSQALGVSEKPIEVFLVGSPAGVEEVRRSVDSSRIRSHSAAAIALAEGRIFAADPAAAGHALKEAGWIDRKIQILTAANADAKRQQGQRKVSLQRQDKQSRLNALSQKKTLTAGEQILVLRAMNGS